MQDRPRVALTFDDGPSPWTAPILDLLSLYSVRATFFVIGSALQGHEPVVRRMLAEGHEIGNHTWSHPWLARDCDEARIRDELEKTNRALQGALSESPRRFRAPHYDVDDRVIRIGSELGLAHTHGDITPPDWHEACTATFIAAYVIGQARPDAVVGLHDGDAKRMSSRQRTVDGVKTIIPRLLEQGFDVVTASALEAP